MLLGSSATPEPQDNAAKAHHFLWELQHCPHLKKNSFHELEHLRSVGRKQISERYGTRHSRRIPRHRSNRRMGRGNILSNVS